MSYLNMEETITLQGYEIDNSSIIIIKNLI